MKKALIIAFDCNPYLESESLIAFKTALYLSEKYEITILSKPECIDAVQKWEKENNTNIFKLVPLNCPKDKKRVDNTKGVLRLYFLSKYLDHWMEACGKLATKLFQEEHYDLIYRVTPNSYRKIPDISGCTGCYKLIGPVGGAQEIPENLLVLAKGKNRIVEHLHRYSNRKVLKSKKFQKRLQAFDCVLCCNQETYECLKSLVGQQKVQIVTDVGIEEKEIVERAIDNHSGPTRLLWIGRFMFRKGLDLLLDSLAKIKEENFQLTLVGDGEYLNHIKERVVSEGLEGKVVFTGRVPHAQIAEYYRLNDVFVFPSLRESSGNVLLEAQCYGLPVVALDIGGASVILDSKNNYLVDLSGSYQDVVDKFASSIKSAIGQGRNENVCFTLQQYVKDTLVWPEKINMIEDIIER